MRLYAPRKYGKTSLLRRVLADGEREEGLIPVLVDLYRVASIADVTVRLERAYARHLKGAVRARVDQFLQRTGIGLSLGVHGISARIQLDPKVDPLPALHALLDLPLRLEQSGGYRALIAFDEFQDVQKVPDLDGLIRSHIQYHGDVASYVFAGSEPGLMKQLFEDRDRPLYGSAVPMRLGRLEAVDVGAYVAGASPTPGETWARRSARCCRRPTATRSAPCCSHTGSGPVERGSSATLEDWHAAHEAALAELSAEFDAEWRHLDTSAQKTLRSILEGDGSPYRGDVLARLALTKDMVRKALPRLAASAMTERNGDRHELVDPLSPSGSGAGRTRRTDVGR